MKDTLSEIIKNEEMRSGYHLLRLRTGWKSYVPGQFVMAEIPGGGTLLRRPFGIARLDKGVIEVCFKIVGKGTEALSRAKKGERMYVLGPIGNGFDIRYNAPDAGDGRPDVRILVAGGYGIAPLLGLAEELKKGRVAGRNTMEVHLFYGARSSDHLLYLNEFRKLGVKLHISTEDGSKGEKCLVTDDLEGFLQTAHHGSQITIFACGPHGMLSAVKNAAVRRSLPCQLSLESYMACGIGACVGCVVKDAKGNYVRVCREGPVFDAQRVSV